MAKISKTATTRSSLRLSHPIYKLRDGICKTGSFRGGAQFPAPADDLDKDCPVVPVGDSLLLR
ncbi:hypothetical protein FMEAI12_4730001 [Parafrankia sp. Ea1.12]|nr:hypothetical protein FMEAI12_4730001 [Parafrankia sp. Ea1.12]